MDLPPGMGPDLRGMLAADEGVLLRPEHARRRLGRPPPALQAAGRGGQPPGRPDLRHRRAHRRAQRRPHLRRRRRYAGRAEGQGRDARGQVRARRQDRLLPDRQDPQGPELGPRPALAPDRDRRQRQGRGVHRRRRRPAPRQGREPRRAPLQHGRQTGHPQGRGRRRTARAPATSSSSPSRRRTPSITTTGSRATSPRSTRPRAARSATSTSRTWGSTA